VGTGVIRLTGGGTDEFEFVVAEDAVPDPVVLFVPALESLALGAGEAGVGFTGGNSSCETAIIMSERNRARKKRLSIQGTGS
jgi:hypothetical protein